MVGISRRGFMATGAAGVLATGALGHGRVRFDDPAEPPELLRASPARVAEFVGACHVRTERVREMLAEEPGLARAAWDWGFGDWETAIGACSHTGRIEIIELLLSHGARPDVFTLATLDEVDAVRAYVERVPNAGSIEGPHSISLFRHARAGRADRVADYLTSKGLDDTRDRFATDEAVARPLVGVFAWGPGPTDRFEVAWVERLGCLSLTPAGDTGRNLMPMPAPAGTGPDALAFRPAGSAGATITFEGPDRLVVRYLGASSVAERS